jgi:hypothetical protein
MKIRIEDNFDLERDVSSKAVINNNRTAYQARLNQIKKRRNQQDEIADIKNDIAEIKALLKNLGGK